MSKLPDGTVERFLPVTTTATIILVTPMYRYSLLSLCLGLTFLTIVTCESSYSQETFSGPIDGTFVPTVEPRPAPSPLEQRDLRQRPDADMESVSSLIQNIQGSDAVMEVVVGRSRILTLQEPLAVSKTNQVPIVAVGDPTVIEFDVLPTSQMIRLLGRRVGMSDLSVVTASGKTFTFEIRVVYDLNYLRAYLKQLFPTASVSVMQMHEHVVIEGEAASVEQSAAIVQTVQAYLASAQVSRKVEATEIPQLGQQAWPDPSGLAGEDAPEIADLPSLTNPDEKPDTEATLPPAQVINLIHVPGVQQVMLQVKIAEVNRTALRQMGNTLLYQDSSGRTFGVRNGSANPLADGGGNFLGLTLGGSSSSFAIFPNTSFAAAFDALRSNQVISILAEPNLMALHGQKASFLAGGEFPVPIPQAIGAGGGAGTFTVRFKEFGVLLNFIPYIMDNGAIRLQVAPEVSTIDPSIGISNAGITIPGVNTRRANTTVELHQGQTLALAGLLQVSLNAETKRIPGMGDLPYIGSLFSNNSHQRVEKELVILVSPYLVAPMASDEVGPLPGCEIKDPDDKEFFWLNRIEGRHPNNDYRATNSWSAPIRNYFKPKVATKPVLNGPYGFSR